VEKNPSEKANGLKYCAIFVVHRKFTNVAANRIILPGGPRVGFLI